MRADPLLLTAGEWLGVAADGRLRRGGGAGAFAFTSWASPASPSLALLPGLRGELCPRLLVDGAVSVPVVSTTAPTWSSPPPQLTWRLRPGPSVEQVARNLRGGGRKDPTVEVRLRRVEPQGDGSDRPVVLATAVRDWASGEVSVSVNAQR